MNPLRLRSRVESLEERAARTDCPSLVTLLVYENDNPAAVEAWAASLQAKWPDTLLVLVNHLNPRPDAVPFGLLEPQRIDWS